MPMRKWLRPLLPALVFFLAGFAAAWVWPRSRPSLPPGPAPARPPAASGAPAAPAVVASGLAKPAAPSPRASPAAARPRSSAQPAPEPKSAADFLVPLAGRATAGFGWRRDPVFGDFRFHPGVDLTGRPGQAVVAAYAGTVAGVEAVGPDYGREPAGWEVTVDHPGGWQTRYRFSGRALVRRGQAVNRGGPLGALGTPAALHFALYRSGRAECPAAIPAPPD